MYLCFVTAACTGGVCQPLFLVNGGGGARSAHAWIPAASGIATAKKVTSNCIVLCPQHQHNAFFALSRGLRQLFIMNAVYSQPMMK